MFKFPLDSESTMLVLAPRWADLGAAWQIGLLALMFGLPFALVIWLYRYELRLVSLPHALALLGLRLLILFVLWGVIGLQPKVEGMSVEETSGRVRVAVDLSSSMDETDVGETLARKQIVERILANDGSKLLGRIANRHELELVGFHEHGELSASQTMELLRAKKDSSSVRESNLTLALGKISHSKDDPMLGILLFSDGRHNVGDSPIRQAKQLGELGVPIYPVVIGPRDPPPDLIVADMQTPTRTFLNTTIPVRVQCNVANLPAQEIIVELNIGTGPVRPEHRRIILHKGKAPTYPLEFQVKLDRAGTYALTVKATSKGPEITLANNTMTRIVRVADDKARLLLVDEEARWEYHYVANAFMRDSAIKLDRVLYSPPRIGAIKEEARESAGLAKTKLPEPAPAVKDVDPLWDYDCIFLGDVSRENLPFVDRRRIERYVSERGGTLILMAGKRFMPLAFTEDNDPLAKMFPITETKEWRPDAGFGLRITGEGKLTKFLQLGEKIEDDVWRRLPKHFWGIVGKRKPAASVLLAPMPGPEVASKKETNDMGILVQQNYGFGRVLFVGLDSTWRWRFREGDTYHHRFWGQVARYAAAEKLLPAGNHHVRFGPREPVYPVGSEIELAARLSASLPPLQDPSQARIKLYQRHADGMEKIIESVPLTANPRLPQLLEAKVRKVRDRDLEPGTYRVELDIPQFRMQIAEPADAKEALVKDRDVFRMLPRDQKELLDLSVNWSLMRDLAEKSGGQIFTPENVNEIVDRLVRRIARKEHHSVARPWEDVPMVWWLLGILIGLLCVEWFWRKAVDLP